MLNIGLGGTSLPVTSKHGNAVFPLFVSDFARGIYTLNGVTMSYDDVWTGDGFWVPTPKAFITPGAGLTADNTQMTDTYPLTDYPTLTAKYIQPGPIPTNLLMAGLSLPSADVGLVCVIEYSVTSDDSSKTLPGVAVDFPNDLNTWASGGEFYYNAHGLFEAWGLHDLSSSYLATQSSPLGTHKIAILISQEEYAASVDGGTVFTPSTGTPSDLTNGAPTPTVYVHGDAATNARATMARFTVYPRVSPTLLPTLSA